MAHRKKIIRFVILAAIIASIGGYWYYRSCALKEKKLFTTTRPSRRTISHVVNTTGRLEAKGTLNIGSLINGVVKELHAEENQEVKKGQLLAVIDNGKGDTDVKRAAGLLKQVKADLTYQTEFFKRQKELYDAQLISPNEFDQTVRSYKISKANVQEKQALLEQAAIDYNNTRIKSPIDGVVISKHVSLREGVANFSPPTILYTIAQDIRAMNAELEIDETDIGPIKVGQNAELHFDTYPHKLFGGPIKEVSSSPTYRQANITYTATIRIENKELLLKPGMTVHARIVTGRAKDAFAIPGYLFSLDKKLLKIIGKKMGYAVKRLTAQERKAFTKKIKNKENAVKALWIFQGNAFVQIPVEVGISDNAFFEIVSGLDGTEEIITDLVEPDVMEKLYKQFFGAGLGGKK